MKRTALLLVCFASMLFTSCQSDNVSTKISNEEAIAAGKRLEEVLLSRSAEGYAAFIDDRSILKNIREKSHASESEKRDFKVGPSIKNLADEMMSLMKTGSCDFLRNYEKDGRQHLVFRTISEMGFNYQDYSLVKVKGIVKADDIYIYAAGNEISTTVAETLDALLQEAGSKNEKEKQVGDVILMRKKRKQGDYEGVKEIYDRLPEELQNSKGILMIYIMACNKINESVYKAALEKFARLYPDAPNTYMLMIDVYFMTKEYEKVITAVNKIDSLVGGDHYLEFFRGNVYRMMGKPAESKACYEKTYANEPELVANMESLIVVYMEDKEEDKAKKVVAEYKTSKMFNQKELDRIYESYPVLKN